MIQCNSINTYRVSPKHIAFLILNPGTCNDFKHLIGQRAIIDGGYYKITAVERRPHAPPYRAGEPISVIVEDA